MNKAELIETLYDEFDGTLTKMNCTRAINTVFEAAEEALKKGDTFAIQGFGSFKTVVSEARTGYNPSTGEKIQIPEKNRVKFVPSKRLKELLQS